ncbi:hypothetical protein B0H67DRAFT_570156 [Lasiosphaeris hirsuta]|uniref:Uncharacterized protein n=1 Tax=Lasiosphaeris hirsuta TaxID=260670 RepID=A0AA40B081_9PEZI|nr:hypothetical protein B0H67DRAFT_570156 [Lasiosphaeris hirsuta]
MEELYMSDASTSEVIFAIRPFPTAPLKSLPETSAVPKSSHAKCGPWRNATSLSLLCSLPKPISYIFANTVTRYRCPEGGGGGREAYPSTRHNPHLRPPAPEPAALLGYRRPQKLALGHPEHKDGSAPSTTRRHSKTSYGGVHVASIHSQGHVVEGLGLEPFRLEEEWDLDTVTTNRGLAPGQETSYQYCATRATAKVHIVQSDCPWVLSDLGFVENPHGPVERLWPC